MNTENPTFEFPADPDFGVWTRAVERAMEAIEDRSGEPVDFYPNEELVLGVVAMVAEELGYEPHPDEGDDTEHVESALIEAMYE
jgi:hypothetical protein